MLTHACLSLALLVAIPAWSQALPTATGGSDSGAPISPMVSGQNLPSTTRSEARSNYLDCELMLRTSYYDNLLASFGSQPISDVAYSISPSIEFDKSTPRWHQTWSYRPGFTLYQRTTSRNDADQNAGVDVDYRLTEHITLSGKDNFQKTSNIFNQSFSLADAPISGAPPSSPAKAIAPFAAELTNAASAELTYQFSANETVGATGTGTIFNYPDQAESPGLYNSNSVGGSAFYNRRLISGQSIGVNYQHVRVNGQSAIGQLEIQTNTLYLFYTATPGEGLTLSVSAGPQHYNYAQSPLPLSSALTLAVTTSVGWQGQRTSLAANYSRTVTAGAGQQGALSSNTSSVVAYWQLERTWSVGSTATYAIYKNVTPVSLLSGQGGHSISGLVFLDHSLSDHFRAQLGYQRLHQTYNGIAAIAADPDVDGAFISLSYQLSRPLGR